MTQTETNPIAEQPGSYMSFQGEEGKEDPEPWVIMINAVGGLHVMARGHVSKPCQSVGL